MIQQILVDVVYFSTDGLLCTTFFLCKLKLYNAGCHIIFLECQDIEIMFLELRGAIGANFKKYRGTGNGTEKVPRCNSTRYCPPLLKQKETHKYCVNRSNKIEPRQALESCV